MSSHAHLVDCHDGRRGRTAPGPLLSMPFRCADSGATTGQPGRARRLGSAVFAALRLPCAARVRGPVAQLATLTAFAALEQSRRVSARSALRARAPHPVLLGASNARRARPGCPVAEPVVACGLSNTDAVAGKAAGGAWAGRIGAAEEVSRDTNGPGDRLCLANGRASWPGAACKARASGRAPWRASSSDSSRLSERSERSERSELSDGPEDRAPQGPRSAAKGQPSEFARWQWPVAAAGARTASSSRAGACASPSLPTLAAAHQPEAGSSWPGRRGAPARRRTQRACGRRYGRSWPAVPWTWRSRAPGVG